MNATMRRTLVGTATVTMALSLTACGDSGGDDHQGAAASSSAEARTIGLLLPENTSSSRYENFDQPFFTAKVKELCADCTVTYGNAEGSAAKQKEQFDMLISRGVKVIALAAVDARATPTWIEQAKAQGVKVVAYDRLAGGPVAAYVSFDNWKVGELQGQALLEAMGPKASDASIVMINGDEGDPNAAKFRAGAHKALDGRVKRIAFEQSGEWKPPVAAQKINAAIAQLGKNNIQGVYSANDGMATAIIAQLKAAGINVPVGGQDAGLDAIQRIVAGEQAYTVYKPYKPLADSAAELAVSLLKGRDVRGVATETVDSDTATGIPARLLRPQVVTKANIMSTVVNDGLYRAAEICTTAYANACTAAGVR
ncbi:sugar ABC transporter substrate-binding protein [Kitasatospora sp. NPDC004240]